MVKYNLTLFDRFAMSSQVFVVLAGVLLAMAHCEIAVNRESVAEYGDQLLKQMVQLLEGTLHFLKY